MKLLLYGPGTLLVADTVAYTVIDYAAALAQSGLADRVEVPTIDLYGDAAETSLLLTPNIPLLATTAPEDALETDPPAAVREQIDRFLQDIAWRIGAVRSGHSHHR